MASGSWYGNVDSPRRVNSVTDRRKGFQLYIYRCILALVSNYQKTLLWWYIQFILMMQFTLLVWQTFNSNNIVNIYVKLGTRVKYAGQGFSEGTQHWLSFSRGLYSPPQMQTIVLYPCKNGVIWSREQCVRELSIHLQCGASLLWLHRHNVDITVDVLTVVSSGRD